MHNVFTGDQTVEIGGRAVARVGDISIPTALHTMGRAPLPRGNAAGSEAEPTAHASNVVVGAVVALVILSGAAAMAASQRSGRPRLRKLKLSQSLMRQAIMLARSVKPTRRDDQAKLRRARTGMIRALMFLQKHHHELDWIKRIIEGVVRLLTG